MNTVYQGESNLGIDLAQAAFRLKETIISLHPFLLSSLLSG
jgi:hypothetical protein